MSKWSFKVSKSKRFDDFAAAMRGLALMTRTPIQQVIEHETARVLEMACGRTKVADVQKIIRRHEGQLMTRPGTKDNPFIAYMGPESKSNNPKVRQRLIDRAAKRRGAAKNGRPLFALPAFSGAARKGGGGAGKHKHPSWLWDAISRRRADRLEQKLEMRGVAAKHFAEIARLLELNIKVKGEVAAAKSHYKFNVRGQKYGTRYDFKILGQNMNEVSVVHAKGRQAFQSAVLSRANAYKKAMEGALAGNHNAFKRQYSDLLAA
jgi:hypothetical protein